MRSLIAILAGTNRDVLGTCCQNIVARLATLRLRAEHLKRFLFAHTGCLTAAYATVSVRVKRPAGDGKCSLLLSQRSLASRQGWRPMRQRVGQRAG